MARVKAHTRRTKTGRVVYVDSYENGKRKQPKLIRGETFQPDIDTAALYDPSRPGRPFAGRVAEGQSVPKGLRRYHFDDTKLVQERTKTRRTLGRTEDPYTKPK